MIRTKTSQVVFDFSDGNYRAGELERQGGGAPGHGGVSRASERVSLPVVATVLGSDEPLYDEPVAVIHSTPEALRRFCEDTLEQLRS
jgi:hypothetical protein